MRAISPGLALRAAFSVEHEGAHVFDDAHLVVPFEHSAGWMASQRESRLLVAVGEDSLDGGKQAHALAVLSAITMSALLSPYRSIRQPLKHWETHMVHSEKAEIVDVMCD